MAKKLSPEKLEIRNTKSYFDCIAPSTIKFMNNHYIVGDSYRCVWAIREYPPSTEEQAKLLNTLKEPQAKETPMRHTSQAQS